MKKISVTLVALFVCITLSAQYKKASFLEKEGRTYAIGTRMYAMGDGKGSPLGYFLGFGKDADGKQLFTWWEFQFIPSYKFSFETANYDGLPIVVDGTTKATFIYAYNFGYHLLKNESAEQKIKPYVTAGFNMKAFGGVKESYYNDGSNKKSVPETAWGFGIGGGAGCMYNITSWLALKVEGGYMHQFNFTPEDNADHESYFLFTSHPYASAGLRFRLVQD